MSNRWMCRALGAVACGVFAAAVSTQQPVLAHGESTETASQVSGSYQDTWFPYDAVQALTEAESAGGKPSKRISELGHVWYFDVPATPSVALQVRAARTDSGEGDDFEFFWSADQGQRWSSTGYAVASDTMPQTADEVALTADTTTGTTLWIRVADTDDSEGHRALDTLTVDYLAIVPAEPPPPDAPLLTQASGMSASEIFVGWIDLATDEDGYRIERSLPGANAWMVAGTIAGTVGAGAMLFVDDGLPASTSYDYRVFAFNAQGDSEPSETVPAVTRAVGSYAAEVAIPYDSGHQVDFADHASTAGGEVLLGFGGDGVHLATRDPATRTWTTELVDPSRVDSSGGDFGLAPDGTPCFTYIETISDSFVPNSYTPIRNVRFAERRQGAWQISLIDTEAAEEGVSLAFDPTDPDGQDLAIAYGKFQYKFVSFSQEFVPGLYVARRIDGQWTVDNVDPDAARVLCPSIAFGPDGELMVAYQDLYKSRGYLNDQIKRVVHDGSAWLAPEVVVRLDQTSVRIYPSLAVNPLSGRPAIASGKDDTLLFSEYDGAAWSTRTVATAGQNERFRGIHLEPGPGGEPYLAFARDSGLFLMRPTGATWSTECIDPVGRSIGDGAVGLDIDVEGEATFSYRAQVGGAGMTVFARR